MSLQTFDIFRARMSVELKRAMKARDKNTVDALRAVLNAVDNATAVTQTSTVGSANEVTAKPVTREEIETIILQNAQELGAAAIKYVQLGKPDEAQRLKAQANVMRLCLAYLQPESETSAGAC